MGAINCPHCGVRMTDVSTESHYGSPIVLDQCIRCGGLWFDQDESYHVKIGEANKIEKLDAKKLARSKPLTTIKLKCPRDQKPLFEFKDLNLPKDLHIDNCRECGGFWFNRGTFVSYQNYRKEKMGKANAAKKETEFEKQVKGILAAHSESGKDDTLGRLGKFLSQPAQRFELSSTTPSKGDITSIVMQILYILFRILLGR